MRGLLIFGSQGSGKSTYAPYIAKKLGVSYLATGNIFREEMARKTPLGEAVQERMAQGILIDDDITWGVLKPYLEKAPQGFLLDGFPRNLNQVEMLQAANIDIEKIFYVKLPPELALARLMARKRDDDTEVAIRNRLNAYKLSTVPVVDYYRRQGVEMVEIDNQPAVERVKKSIDDYLKN